MAGEEVVMIVQANGSVLKTLIFQRGSFLRACLLCLLLQSSLFVTVMSAPHIAPRRAAPHANYIVNGTVFNDSNENGVQDIAPAANPPRNEPGVAGVTVIAYDSSGTIVGSPVTSDALGQYSLSIPVGTAARVEFSGFGPTSSDPTLQLFQPSVHNATAGNPVENTVTNFVSTTATVNLGLVRSDQYCQNNPTVVTSCYVFGVAGNAAAPVLVGFPYTNTGTTPSPTLIEQESTLGTVWGLAYRRSTDTLFAASYIKRHTALGPGGKPGDIYAISGARSGAPSVPSVFTTLNPAEVDPHAGNYLQDYNIYDQVGKIGLGGLALSEDESTLYAVNLSRLSLDRIPLGTPPALTAGIPASATIPIPSDCPGTLNGRSDFEPFGVAVHNGVVYVGAVCSAESTVSGVNPLGIASQMHAYVLSYLPSTGFTNVNTPTLEFPLNYPRRCANGAGAGGSNYPTCAVVGNLNSTADPGAWNAWHTGYIRYRNSGASGTVEYPQPMFTAITFDNNGDMILGLRDRFGDQMGKATQVPPGSPYSSDGSMNVATAGDILRACVSGSGWVLENNAFCGGTQTTGNIGNNVNRGPGGGEYYYGTKFYPFHDYISGGGLLQLAGLPEVMYTAFDPIDNGTTFDSGGTRTLSNTTGNYINTYQIYHTTAGQTTLAKADGLGSLVALCQAAPLEIGHRIWLDSNGNGIQDAGEPGIAGVTASLFDSTGTRIGSTTTDANGDYYFNNTNESLFPDKMLSPYVTYSIKLDNPTDYQVGGALAGYSLSPANQGSDVNINSKGILPGAGAPGAVNAPAVNMTAHTPGQNDFTFDFGFSPPPDLAISNTNTGGNNFQVGQNVTYNVVVSNVAGAGPVVSPNGISVSDTLPTGYSNLLVNPVLGWDVSLSTTTSPSTLTATYIGPLPVTGGTTLPTITVTGTLNSLAPPNVTSIATVNTLGDSNSSNNSSTDVVNVAPVVVAPDLAITNTNAGGSNFQVGQNVSYNVVVSDVAGAGPVVSPNGITVTDALPTGYDNLVASAGSGWDVSLSSKTGPSTLTATYIGPLPVTGGTTLPTITVTGTLNALAPPVVTSTATVNTPGDSNSSNDSSTDIVTVDASPDLAISNTNTGGSNFQVGQNVSYNVVVSDVVGAGPVVSPNGITVTDTLPTGYSNLVASAGPDWIVNLSSKTGPSTLTATYVGPLPVTGGTTLPTITVTGMLNASAPPEVTSTATVNTLGDSNSSNDSSTDVVTVDASPDLAITNTNTGGSNFQVGQSVSYSLVVHHVVGSGPVVSPNGIMVTDTLPTGYDNLVANGGPDWDVTLSSKTGPATLSATYVGPLPVSGETTLPTITVTGMLNASAPPEVTSTATVSTPGDSNESNNSSTDVVTVDASPDLAISNTNAGGSNFQVGQNVSYNVVVSDVAGAGPVLSPNGITVTDTLPTGYDNLVANGGPDWIVNLSSKTGPSTLTATYVGPLPVSGGTTLPTITVTGMLNASAPPEVTSTATVNTPGDSNSSNDSSTDIVTIDASPDLAITNTNTGGNNFQVGQNVSYNVVVSDVAGAGPVLSPNGITVTDTLPTGYNNLVASAGPDWIVNLSSKTGPSTLTATYVGPLPVTGGTTLPTITVTGMLNASAPPEVTSTATVNTLGDSNSSNDSSTDVVTVDASPDLAITNTNTGGSNFQVGQSVSYSLVVHHVVGSGPVVSPNGIMVTDTLPTGYNDLVANGGPDWDVTLSSKTGPATLSATYVGPLPVSGETTLPTITVTGMLNASAPPEVTSTATVSTPGDSNESNNSSTDVVTVDASPDLAITNTNTGGSNFQVGQNVSYNRGGERCSRSRTSAQSQRDHRDGYATNRLR